MTSMLSTFHHCDRGASAVELALVAPFFAAMVIGMSDLASAYSMKLRLEQAAQRSIERLQAMPSPAALANKATVITEATNAATAAGYPSATISVTFTNYCNGSATANYDDSCTGGQTQMKYANVTLTGKYRPLFTNTYFPNHNADGTVTVTGQTGMRLK
jgi:Flp pilus assembly protein TadG